MCSKGYQEKPIVEKDLRVVSFFSFYYQFQRWKPQSRLLNFIFGYAIKTQSFLHPYNEQSLQYGIIQIKIHALYVVCQDMLHINDNTTCIKTKQSQIYLGAELLAKI